MNSLKEFHIDIFNLGLKQHEFEFKIDERLFQLHEHSLIEKGSGTCKLLLDKTATMMTLDFHIDVKIELTCDRSLDTFDYPIQLDEQLIIKFGEENYSLSEEVLVIKGDTPTIDVSEYIYEFINVAVPMKKLHPRYEGQEDEQPDMIYTSQGDEPEENEETVDPRWEALKKLKDNK
ncbi:YceD family protein [Marinoscillum furvescens]|uniref:Uncharacterized metal-binding protein YceD (DUF177 family) n=1 Tax=Marinoscillum furvescens DSM 4134 TaxID=1122208 RepID=A0A3D9L6P0_MARFU|nr:DUF177 domain-containing protein [Marinoscillum furvescens]REE01018.1 uncharacterized metal-binding protein YceD (DUF177 family) [Marinoscillum furvescens DSM 4134]